MEKAHLRFERVFEDREGPAAMYGLSRDEWRNS
jgi:hypothetical protein